MRRHREGFVEGAVCDGMLSDEEINAVAKEINNLLAAKGLSVADAKYALRSAEAIACLSPVQPSTEQFPLSLLSQRQLDAL